MDRHLRARPPLLDLGLAAAVMLVAVVECATVRSIPHPVASGFAEVAMGLALAYRRLTPLGSTAVVAVGNLVVSALGVPPDEVYVPLLASLVATYTVVSYSAQRAATAGAALMLASMAGLVWIAGQTWDNLAFAWTFVAIFWAFGRIIRVRTNQAAEAEVRADRLLRAQKEQAQRIVTEERTRIARELHDVIAHSVSLMVVQAGAAQQVMASEPEAALAALTNVQRTGREAISELGRLLGVLREDSTELGFAPQPTLAQLPRLVDQARAGGLLVELTTDGEPVALPVGVELAVYRVVQEALTNARKHGGDRPSASVRLVFGEDCVTVEVVDDGPVVPTLPSIAGGHGLVGMRERVAAYGGTFTSERGSPSGFRVSARIPLVSGP